MNLNSLARLLEFRAYRVTRHFYGGFSCRDVKGHPHRYAIFIYLYGSRFNEENRLVAASTRFILIMPINQLPYFKQIL